MKVSMGGENMETNLGCGSSSGVAKGCGSSSVVAEGCGSRSGVA